MDTIIADVLKILKDAEDSISWEERVRSYLSELVCTLLGTAMECLDDELAEDWKKEGWRVERRDARTILSTFGPMTFVRRRMEKDDEAGCYPLDTAMGFRAYKRMTAYCEYLIATIAAGATYRQMALAVSTLTPNTISHQQVGNIVRSVGTCCEKQEETEKAAVDVGQELRQPEVLMIEGDAVAIRPQGTQKHLEIHRYQIAEGVRKNGKRRELVGTHYVASFSRQDAMDQMAAYLGSHYDLRNTIVLSNSDGGSGYEKEVFDELIGEALRHEHFRDRYHVNQKIKDRAGWAGKALNNALHKALRERSWERVCTVLDTMAANAGDERQGENVEKLRSYLQRNWDYLAGMEERRLGKYAGSLGTCESNHRLYSYRMKKQGRRWGQDGGRAMVRLLTALKNGELRKAMTETEDTFQKKYTPDFRGAVRRALKAVKFQEHEGIKHGNIALNAPSSSAVGYLAKVLSAGVAC
ncbi:ISLre2 family transposase [Selenomonas sp.]|uniref:ISLre2 family transposase n=1 Tax=Selenomonas sp. TaxID=2053611 RepID=UPI0025E10A13|nr:ISLre2 family transposase [Selenomonas sp.]